MSSNSSANFFEQISLTESFPNQQLIERNLIEYNKNRKVSIIIPWPTYEKWNIITGLAVDNWVSTWQSLDITHSSIQWEWLLIIQWGKMIFSHISEKKQADINKLVDEKRDLCTLPSIKRNWTINENILPEIWSNGRFLVEMTNWRQWVITLKNVTPAIVKKVFSDSQFVRVLYCDWIWNKWQMDGWRIENTTTKKLEYTNHTQPQWSPEVKGNMPALFIIYSQ